MSHFAVLVIGDDIEKALAPFQENNMGDCPQEYLEFCDTTDEVKKDWETDTDTWVWLDGQLVAQTEENFSRIYNKVSEEEYNTFDGLKTRRRSRENFNNSDYYIKRSEIETEEVSMEKVYGTFENYAEAYHGYKVNSQGRCGYFTNPNSKWDWYVVGGRYSNRLLLKPGAKGTRAAYVGSALSVVAPTSPDSLTYVDSAYKGDIDIQRMRHLAAIKAAEDWDAIYARCGLGSTWESWDQVRERFKDNIDEGRKFYHEQPAVKAIYDAEPDKFRFFYDTVDRFLVSREDYIEGARKLAISAYAVLHDGRWSGRGEMLMFGCSVNEKEPKDWQDEVNDLINSLPDNAVLTFVDCHV